MNEKTRNQTNQANDLDTECCDLYAEYCYPCKPAEADDLTQEQTDD